MSDGRVANGKIKRLGALGNRVRGWLLPLVILGALYGFARLVEPNSPIEHWYFWRYFLYWVVTLIWMASCFSCGHAIVRRILRSPLPVLEQVTVNFAVGVLAFFMLMFFGGILRMYGAAWFVALPLFMLAVGARPTFRYLKRLRRHVNAARARGQRPFASFEALFWAFGLIALFLFYVPILVPQHLGYDSSWYHVPIGEHYARLGRIARFPEGWYSGTIPHLASVVYCFAFLLPRGSLFDYMELASHLEFASCLMMLPGIPALVRRLAPGARAHVSWLAFFAFPGLYWYDLWVGGDQFSALWSIPICLGLLRTFPRLDWRHGSLLACGIAGETLTKYSASGILLGPALAIALRMIWLGLGALWRERSVSAAGHAMSGGARTGAAVLLLTTPLWAKNWLWYGDPFYPLLYRYFAPRPWTPDAATYVADFGKDMQTWRPPPGIAGFVETLKGTFSHAFVAADFSPGPLRGALFTLMCGCIPFVRAPWRLWGTAIVVNLAIFGWYFQMHQDRYLIAFMPAMAAVAMATALLAWRTSLAARWSLVALLSFHAVWSLSVFSLGPPNYQYRSLLDFLVAAAAGTPDAGMGDAARWDHIGKTLAKDAKVLVHGLHAHTGLGHPSVSDWKRTAAGVSYGRLASSRAFYDKMREFGVTDLVWATNWGDDSIAGDLRFFEFTSRYTTPRQVDGLNVAAMPSQPPPDTADNGLIAFLGCDRYAAGLYPFSAMTVPNPRNIVQPSYPSPLEVITPETEDTALSRAQYAVLNPACGFKQTALLSAKFLSIGQRNEYELFASKDPHSHRRL
jgi:hypothetical protein